MANQMNFRTTDNGDIFAEMKDTEQLMGVWFHGRQEGTIRIVDHPMIVIMYKRRVVSDVYVTKSLNEWLEILMKLGEEPA